MSYTNLFWLHCAYEVVTQALIQCSKPQKQRESLWSMGKVTKETAALFQKIWKPLQ